MPQDTLARYLGRRRSRGGGWQCYTVLSARHSNTSNASNCGAASLGRYLEDDMVQLHETRRPIVVSFRRRRTQQQDSTGDSEVSGGSTSTGPEIYVSLEELTKNRSRFNSGKISKLKKTRNKLNETYISVICRHSKPISRGVGGKSTKEGGERDGPHAVYTSSSNSSFPYSLRQDTEPESILVPAWHTSNSSSCRPTDDMKEFPVTCDITTNVNGKNKDQSGSCDKSIKYPKVEDIEIFQAEHLKIQRSFKKQQRNSRHSRHTNKHKAQVSSCNSIERSFKESGEGLTLRFNAVRSGKAGGINGTSHCTVPRSSTLPSLRTATNDSEAHTEGLSVPSLKHTQILQTRCDIPNHDNFADGGYGIRSMTRSARSETHRKYFNFNILGCDIISKSESNARNSTASLPEQDQHFNCVRRAARKKYDYLSNYGVNSTAISGADSSFGIASKLLSQRGKNNTIQLSLPEFPLVDGEIPDEKSGHHIQSDIEEEQKIPEKNYPAPSPKDNNLVVQNPSILSAVGCTIQSSNPSFVENSFKLAQRQEYKANKGVCDSTDSKPLCNCRPKSCSDLTVSACMSATQNCQSLTSIAYSSSPRLTADDRPV